MRQPIYCGDHQAICHLPSGEPVVVDTRSDDSLDYLLGWEIERHVMPVFHRLLTPRTRFIDVGANFGAYSAIAAGHCISQGSILAVEANPHVFRLLERTMYCNRARHLPNVRLVNMAASDASGQTVNLSVAPNALGGSSLWRPRQTQGCQDVAVPTTTIDDLVGDDTIIDLVKIDVEGHEPYVLRGMSKLIARSPHINIIMEMFSVIVEGVFGSTRALQEEISSYGLRLFVIGENGALSERAPETPVTGNQYVLLTRDPAQAEGRLLRIDAGALSVSPLYDLRPEHRRPLSPPLERIQPTAHLFYGPYAKLAAGTYRVTFDGALDGPFIISFVSDGGRTIFHNQTINSFADDLEFTLPHDVTDFEVVGTPVSRPQHFVLRQVSLLRL